MPARIRIGSVIAGYRIVDFIDRGGMGTVYLAEHEALQVPVALKLMSSDLAEDPGFRERFQREARLSARLRDQSNVVAVYDAGEFEGTLYIAMRYVDGTDLKSVLDEQHRLDPARTLSVLSQVGSALDAAHAIGLIHRDVKPANILIEPKNDTRKEDACYLADFGLVRQSASMTRLTRTGLTMGTVLYSSPEQLSPDLLKGDPIDGRTDVYSLACVLFECLTGRTPFEDQKSYEDIIKAQLSAEPPNLSELMPGAPKTLDPILKKALAKDRNQRYDRCGELMDAVRAAFAEPPARDSLEPATVLNEAADETLLNPSEEVAVAAAAIGSSTEPASEVPTFIDPTSAGPGLSPARSRSGKPLYRRPSVLIAAALALVALVLIPTLMLSGSHSVGVAPTTTSGSTTVAPPTPTATPTPTVTRPPPLVVATIDVGEEPTDLVFGEGAIWVSNFFDDTVSRIDTTTNKVVKTIDVSSGFTAGPSGLAFGDGAIWVSNYWYNTVSRIDTSTNKVVKSIDVGRGPSGLAFGDGAIWVGNKKDSTVSRIDTTTNKVVKTIDLGRGRPDSLAFGNGAIWVSNDNDTIVSRIDTSTNKVVETIGLTFPGTLAFGDGALWVAINTMVSRIDTNTNIVVKTIAVGSGMVAIAVGDGAVWVTDIDRATVSRIDPENEVVQTFSVGGTWPVALAFSDDGALWVANTNRASGVQIGTVVRVQP